MDFEKRANSKASRFFEWLFAIVIINLFTIVFSILIITFLPAHVAAYQTISDFKEHGTQRVIKRYFSNFWKHIEKSFLIGLFVIIILVVALFSMYFYKNNFDVSNIVGQVGYWVMLIVIIVLLFLSLHLPLVIFNFPKLGIKDTIKISIFICFRYILSTLIILISDVVMIIGVLALPIWVFIGITLPILLIIKFTEPTYYYLKKIDLEKIIEKAKEIENEEDDFRD